MSTPYYFPEYYDDLKANPDEDEIHTPQSFAWKLILDDTRRDALSSQLSTFTDAYDTEEDPISFFFEIVLEVFCELMYGLMKVEFCNKFGPERSFRPKYENIDMIFDKCKEKFAILHLHLRIFAICDENNEDDIHIQEELSLRYCRTISCYNSAEKKALVKSYGQSDDTEYHHLGNTQFEYNQNLKNLFTIMRIKGKTYKISFDRIDFQPKPLSTLNEHCDYAEEY